MLSRYVAPVIVAVALASTSSGIEVGGTVRKIDVEKRVAVVFANGKDRTLKIHDNAKIHDENGKDLDGGLAATELKSGATVTLNVEFGGNVPTIVAIRMGGKVGASKTSQSPTQISVGSNTVGFKPLTEMTAEDRYKGQDGGLYGGGSNELPDSLAAAAQAVSAMIKPLSAGGEPAGNGKIGLVSISMSNATQEFSRFKKLADADTAKSDFVTIVDCAQGGQTMMRWADPNAPCWVEADRRLQSFDVAPDQVQVAWIKLANAGPSGDLEEHGRQLELDTKAVLANLTKKFPNLRIAYLGSRIYGGYADGRLNPEPYAYEGAFVVRWLIQDQIKQSEMTPPLLLWGPYLWADGTNPRKSDGLVWQRSDLVGDGTHPSDTGRQKVAEQLLEFFKTDAYARTWFVKH